MCYAGTTDNPDGTAAAHCYCGWSNTYPDHDTADAAAETTHGKPKRRKPNSPPPTDRANIHTRTGRTP